PSVGDYMINWGLRAILAYLRQRGVTPLLMPQFDLQIRDIYGGVVGTWKPLDAELSVTQNETGSITGGFGRSDPTVTRNFFGPYRNDWFFYRDNRLLKSGPITNAGWSDQSEGMITMAGKTWEHLLDRRIWY